MGCIESWGRTVSLGAFMGTLFAGLCWASHALWGGKAVDLGPGVAFLVAVGVVSAATARGVFRWLGQGASKSPRAKRAGGYSWSAVLRGGVSGALIALLIAVLASWATGTGLDPEAGPASPLLMGNDLFAAVLLGAAAGQTTWQRLWSRSGEEPGGGVGRDPEPV